MDMNTYPPDYLLVIFLLIIVKALVTASNTYRTFSTQSIFGSLFLKFLMQIHLECLFWLTGDNWNSTFGNLRCV